MLFQLRLACQWWSLQKRKGDRTLWCIVRRLGASSTAAFKQKMCVKEGSIARGWWKPRLLSIQRVRNAKKKKKIVRISSSSFLGKEHEMDCARITRKNYRPHWGQWRRIYGKEAVGSSSERKTEMAGPRKIEAEGSKLWLKFLNCRSQENHIFVQIKTK